ncbi:MAG: hypothetical protein NT061_01450 [Spirochaetes bacterium]|nr:hypothetical protein [Spirochaetota bacterium]
MRPQGPEILLCTEGAGLIARAEGGGSSSGTWRLARGDSAFVSAACGPYSLSGSGRIYLAQSGLGAKAGS